MVMVIKSNVASNVIANPDGWNPPFSTEGMLYAGIYGRGELSKNFAPGRPDATVVGSPTLTDNFLSVDFNNYIETGVATTKAATLIAIAHRKAASTRQFFITSYKGTGAFGRSLLAEGASSPQIAIYSHYRGIDDKGTSVDAAKTTAIAQVKTDNSPGMMYCTDDGKILAIGDKTENRLFTAPAATGTVESVENTAITYRIGRAISPEVPTSSNIAAALIFDRALPAAEIQAIYTYFQEYFARRSVII